MPSLEHIFERAHHCVFKPIRVVNNFFLSTSVHSECWKSISEAKEIVPESRSRSLARPFPDAESLCTKLALGLPEELHAVSTSRVKTVKKLASASREEVILLEQHKSLIGFLASPAV